MTTVTVPRTIVDKNLDTACASVVNEIGRTDGKASLFSELLGSRGGRWRSFIRTRCFGNQFGWLCLKALRSERALAGRGPRRGRWGAGGVGTCVGAACRGFPRNPVESQRPEVVGSCSMLR